MQASRAVLIAFALSWTLPAALAGDQEDCVNEALKAARVEACKRLIDAHGPRDEELAKLYDQRAAAHAANDAHADAAEDLGAALRIRPPSVDGLLKRGAAWLRANDTDKALRDFNDAVVAEPGNAEAKLWRGRAYRVAQQFDNAIRDLNAVVAAKPADADGYMARGLTYDDMKEFQKAVADYSRVRQIKPDSLSAAYNRGWAYLQLGDYKAALSDLEACARIDPDDPDCFDMRAQVLNQSGDHRAAAQAYAQAIARAPSNPRFYNGRAVSLRKAGDYEGAIAELSKSLEIETDMQVLYDRGWLYAASGRPDNAISDYSIILRREGADSWPGALIERGLARIVRGDLKAAQEDLAAAESASPDNARTALWTTALKLRFGRDQVFPAVARTQILRALKARRQQLSPARYEAPFIQALLGERDLAEAHRVSLMAIKDAEDRQDAECFVHAMAGALAVAQGDDQAATGFYARVAPGTQTASYACMIAKAELNRIRNK